MGKWKVNEFFSVSSICTRCYCQIRSIFLQSYKFLILLKVKFALGLFTHKKIFKSNFHHSGQDSKHTSTFIAEITIKIPLNRIQIYYYGTKSEKSYLWVKGNKIIFFTSSRLYILFKLFNIEWRIKCQQGSITLSGHSKSFRN